MAHVQRARSPLGAGRPLALALTLLMTLGGVAACGGGGTPAGAATKHTAATATKDTSGTGRAVKFSQCMRENGVPGFPDPGADGELNPADLPATLRESGGQATLLAALTACREYAPTDLARAKNDPEAQQRRLKTAQCIREHGVPDWPDPDPAGGFGLPKGITFDDPSVRKALEACRSLLGSGR